MISFQLKILPLFLNAKIEDRFEKLNKTPSFFSSDPSDDEAVEKASGNRTATQQDSKSKPAVKKKRKQVCKFSNCIKHGDDNA